MNRLGFISAGSGGLALAASGVAGATLGRGLITAPHKIYRTSFAPKLPRPAIHRIADSRLAELMQQTGCHSYTDFSTSTITHNPYDVKSCNNPDGTPCDPGGGDGGGDPVPESFMGSVNYLPDVSVYSPQSPGPYTFYYYDGVPKPAFYSGLYAGGPVMGPAPKVVYYPQKAPPSQCLTDLGVSATTAVISIVAAVRSNPSKYSALVVSLARTINLGVAGSLTAMEFLTALGSIALAPEFLTLMAIGLGGLAAYMLYERCVH